MVRNGHNLFHCYVIISLSLLYVEHPVVYPQLTH